MQQEVQYRGQKVFFAGKEWTVPSLSTAQFEDHYETLANPVQGNDKASIKARFDAFIPLIGMALRRNYPEVNDDVLRQQLDLATFPQCLRAIQNASGLVEAAPGEV